MVTSPRFLLNRKKEYRNTTACRSYTSNNYNACTHYCIETRNAECAYPSFFYHTYSVYTALYE